MRSPSRTAASLWSWLLTLVFVAGIDTLMTRTSCMWPERDVRSAGDVGRTVFWQVYEVARKLHHPTRLGDVNVVVLGNSRVWLPARAAYVERELRRRAPERDCRVHNLAVFGARIGDMEIIARQALRLRPDLLVLALGGEELVPGPDGRPVGPQGLLLDVGWRDGPVPPAGWAARVHRWVRTAWPLFRYRVFLREVIHERLRPYPGDSHFPPTFASTRQVFDFLHGDRGETVEKAYRAFVAHPTFESYLAYLRTTPLGPGPRNVPPGTTVTRDAPGARVLEALLRRQREQGVEVLVLLTPRNPMLDLDTEGRFHEIGFSDRTAAVIRDVAGSQGVRVVDGRRWMPPEAFLDFRHLLPDVSGFHVMLAKEILDALER